MNTEQLKIIIDLISRIGAEARGTFIWWIAYNLVSDVMICVTWVLVPVLSIKAIFKGMKENKDDSQ